MAETRPAPANTASKTEAGLQDHLSNRGPIAEWSAGQRRELAEARRCQRARRRAVVHIVEEIVREHANVKVVAVPCAGASESTPGTPTSTTRSATSAARTSTAWTSPLRRPRLSGQCGLRLWAKPKRLAQTGVKETFAGPVQ